MSSLRLSLILLLVVPALAAGQPQSLQLASTSWSPFTNDPGEPRYALDLVSVALQRMGVTAETTIIEESQLTPALLRAEFDGSAALWRDEQRERVLIYSEPYLENRLILVGLQGSDVSAASLAELAGRRVALVDGYAYGEADELAGPTYVASASEEDSLTVLLRGDADYALMDALVAQYLLTHHEEQARTRLAFGSSPLLTRTLHFALHRDVPNAAAIVEGFNRELQGMIADRSYHVFLHLEWIRADVDGDGLQEYVPRDDETPRAQPGATYQLFSSAGAPQEPAEPRRFYWGGDIYEDWSTVPDRYKAPTTDPQPGQYAATVFRFSW